jgi:transcriptional regulator with XRE-family HTH domain
MMTSGNLLYPKLKQKLTQWRKDANLSIAELAKKAGMPQPTLQSYLRGVRCPTEKNIQALAGALFSNRRSSDRAEKEILEACQKPAVPFLEGLAEGHTQLDVETVGFLFPPIAEGNIQTDKLNDKLEEFYARSFHHLLGRTPTKGLHSKRNLGERYEELSSGKYDLFLNYLCSPQRLLAFEFLLTPIRVSLNACCIRKRGNIEEIKNHIIGKGSANAPIRLIAVRWSVAAWHAKYISKCPLIEIGDLSIDELAKELTRLAKNPTITPVVLATEPTAMGVAANLKGKGCLVFPVSGSADVQFFEPRRELPEFGLGFALKRGHNAALKEYLQVALHRYLTDSVAPTARLYADLYEPLYSLTQETLNAAGHEIELEQWAPTVGGRFSGSGLDLRRCARSYARHSLRLNAGEIERFSDPVLPWKQMLTSARALICSRESEDRAAIREEVEDRINRLSIDTPENLQRGWALGLAQQLENDFDIQFSHLPREFAPKSLRTPEDVVSLVQAALFNCEVLTPPISVFTINETNGYARAQLESLWGDTPVRVAGYTNIARIVAQRGHLIVGTAYIRKDRDGRMYLQDLLVAENHRERHVGLRMVWEGLRYITAISMDRKPLPKMSEVFVRPNRMETRTRDWFRRLGFAEATGPGERVWSYRFARFADV